jgi:hypothetical protein
VNGALTESVPSPGSIPSTVTTFRFGSEGAGQEYRGLMDELAVYDKALPAARVLAHYRAGHGM